jgi:hypothetical protein
MAKKTGHIFTSRVLFSALSSTDRSLSSLPRDEARASIDRVLADVGIAPVDAVLKNVAAGREKKTAQSGYSQNALQISYNCDNDIASQSSGENVRAYVASKEAACLSSKRLYSDAL